MPRNSFHFTPGITGGKIYVYGELLSLVGLERDYHVFSEGIDCVSEFMWLDVDVHCVVKLQCKVAPTIEIVIDVDKSLVKEIAHCALRYE